jgi:hypothetical protein
MPARGAALPAARRAARDRLAAVSASVAAHWGLLAALLATVVLHAPSLRYYFNGDDFVVLGNIEWAGTRGYVADSFFLRDYVPSWRPLTAIIYAAEWRLFGFHAEYWRAFALAWHLAAVALLYALVVRTMRRPAIAAVAALLFGVSGAHYETVTYVTALPHLIATTSVLAGLLALVAYVQGGERRPLLFAAACAALGVAFLANESAFSYAPLFALAYALGSRRWSPWRPWRLLAHGAPFAALALGWLAFYFSTDNEQLRFSDGEWGWHTVSNSALYLSWLAYPVRTIPLDPDRLRWAIGGAVALALVAFAARGGLMLRLAAAGVVLSLAPFVPVIWTTSRYSYGAAAFFAVLLAAAAVACFERLRPERPALRAIATSAALAFVAAIAALHAWQSYAHDARTGRDSERWRLLVSELRRNVPVLPPGAQIWIVDGPWTEPLSQWKEVPNVPRAIYGDGIAVDLPLDQYRRERPAPRPNEIFLRWDGARLRIVSREEIIPPE